MQKILASLSILAILFDKLSTKGPEYISADNTIQQYWLIGKTEGLSNTDSNSVNKSPAYNLKSEKEVNSVSLSAINHSSALINCSDIRAACIRETSPTVTPTPTTAIPKPTIIPHPTCPPPPPCYQKTINGSNIMPCMYIDAKEINTAIICPELM